MRMNNITTKEWEHVGSLIEAKVDGWFDPTSIIDVSQCGLKLYQTAREVLGLPLLNLTQQASLNNLFTYDDINEGQASSVLLSFIEDEGIAQLARGEKEVNNKPVKSDGGSSTYYDIPVPQWLLDLLQERYEGEGCYVKTEEFIEILGSDFDESNIFKCLVRINSLKKGVGKEGNSVDYDANKIIYSANRLKEREKR